MHQSQLGWLHSLLWFARLASLFQRTLNSIIAPPPMLLDKYDYVILDIIHTFKKNNKSQLIKLTQLEANFWTRIERDDAMNTRSAQLGERVANLYLEGYLVNKSGSGYTLTRKGKEELNLQSDVLVESYL
jgi:hypothetical protein